MQNFEYFEWINERNLVLRGSIHPVEKSDAPWVIFCHGFTGQRMGPGYLFVKLARQLHTCGFSSLRFDFAGSGESDGLFRDMTVKTMEQDLLFIVKELRAQRKPSSVILLGHSFGGMIAAMHAGTLAVNGLILISPVGNPEGLIQRRKELLDAGANCDGLYENGPHEMSLSFLDTLRGFNPVEIFATTFQGRLLLLQGDQDLSISVDESMQYKMSAERNGIDTQYQVIEGADHNYSKVSYVKMVTSTVCDWTKEHFS
jgi:pimeloyl-ACP methyl ester carboxylesterase